MNRKKLMGFTLIELLAVIAILGVILSISLYAFSFSTDNVNEEVDEINKNALLSAANIYFNEFSHNGNWNSYTIKEDGVDTTYSCVSLYNLINSGIYDTNNAYTKEMLDNVAVKIKTVNGVSTYEYIDNYNTDSDCTYWVNTDDLSDAEIDISYGNADSDEISVVPVISSNDDGTYNLRIKFSAELYEEIVEYEIPVYVLIVLDSSGSMEINDRYDPAVDASINLSQHVPEGSYVGLVNFDYKSYLQRGFEINPLTRSNFRASVSGQLTNILAGLDTAYNMMNNISYGEVEPLRYVIFLTDGTPSVPNYSSTYYDSREQYDEYSKCDNDSISSTCRTTLIEYTNMIKNNSSLIVIGYDLNTSYDVYKQISSIDNTMCSNSSYKSGNNSYCYYDSSSSQINSLFNNIITNISEVVQAQTVSKTNVKLNLGVNAIIVDENGNEVSDVVDITYDLSNISEDLFTKENVYTIKLNDINDDDFECNYETKRCTYDVQLFDEFVVYLYDGENNLKNTIIPESMPTITLTKTLKSYMN